MTRWYETTGQRMTDSERSSRWKKANPDKVRNMTLKRKYGMTLEEWNRLFESQDKKCAICKSKTPKGPHWHTDHDHQTDKVRGILCNLCNTGLGKFEDDVSILLAAVQYLEKSTF